MKKTATNHWPFFIHGTRMVLYTYIDIYFWSGSKVGMGGDVEGYGRISVHDQKGPFFLSNFEMFIFMLLLASLRRTFESQRAGPLFSKLLVRKIRLFFKLQLFWEHLTHAVRDGKVNRFCVFFLFWSLIALLLRRRQKNKLPGANSCVAWVIDIPTIRFPATLFGLPKRIYQREMAFFWKKWKAFESVVFYLVCSKLQSRA